MVNYNKIYCNGNLYDVLVVGEFPLYLYVQNLDGAISQHNLYPLFTCCKHYCSALLSVIDTATTELRLQSGGSIAECVTVYNSKTAD